MCAVIRYVTVYYMLHKVELPFVYTYKKTKPWMNFPGLDFVRTLFKFKKRKENLSSFVQSSPLENVVSGIFHVQVVQLWSKKCTKKRKAGRMSVNLSPPPPPPPTPNIFTNNFHSTDVCFLLTGLVYSSWKQFMSDAWSPAVHVYGVWGGYLQ